MSERDELAADIRGLGITVIDGPPVDLTEPLAQHLHNLGYRRPRTIESAYEENGPSEMPPLSVVLSGGKPAIRQYDHTWMDWDGTSWDDWELEYPLTVLHEPEATE